LSSNFSFSNSTSERYALALFQLSQENKELDQTEKEAKSLKQLLNNNSFFKYMISSPILGKENQSKAILKIADKFNFSQIFKKFLGFVTSKGRLFFLEKIIDNFLKLVSKSKGEINAKLLSAKELTTDDISMIQKNLSENFDSNIKINYKHDPNLLGGLIIQIGSKMIDTTIRSKLKKLETIMIEK